jgi:hypothetical protein
LCSRPASEADMEPAENKGAAFESGFAAKLGDEAGREGDGV